MIFDRLCTHSPYSGNILQGLSILKHPVTLPMTRFGAFWRRSSCRWSGGTVNRYFLFDFRLFFLELLNGCLEFLLILVIIFLHNAFYDLLFLLYYMDLSM